MKQLTFGTVDVPTRAPEPNADERQEHERLRLAGERQQERIEAEAMSRSHDEQRRAWGLAALAALEEPRPPAPEADTGNFLPRGLFFKLLGFSPATERDSDGE